VLIVHDKISGREVVEMPLSYRLTRPCTAMSAATAGDIRFSEKCEADLRQSDPTLERSDHDVSARRRKVFASAFIE
jgi:hypothetical protein